MAQDVYPVSPMGGFLIDSNGDKVNIADIMGTVTPISGWEVNPKNFPAYPLCVAGSDGKVYNLADLLKSAGGGGGSGGGYLKVGINNDTGVLDKTWNEIKTALANGYYVSLVIVDGNYCQHQNLWCELDDKYKVTSYYYDGAEMTTMLFVADSADGYPVFAVIDY